MKKLFLLALFISLPALAHNPVHPIHPMPSPSVTPGVMPYGMVTAPVPGFLAPQIPSINRPYTVGHTVKLLCGFTTVILLIGSGGTAALWAVVPAIFTTKAAIDGPDARGSGHDNAQALFACVGLKMGST